MSDQRPVCAPCRAIMQCSKNEVLVDAGGGYIKSGDQYTCPVCDYSVIMGFGEIYQARSQQRVKACM